jgi:hypothetical protein
MTQRTRGSAAFVISGPCGRLRARRRHRPWIHSCAARFRRFYLRFRNRTDPGHGSRRVLRHNVLSPVPPVAFHPLPGGGAGSRQSGRTTRSEVHLSSTPSVTRRHNVLPPLPPAASQPFAGRWNRLLPTRAHLPVGGPRLLNAVGDDDAQRLDRCRIMIVTLLAAVVVDAKPQLFGHDLLLFSWAIAGLVALLCPLGDQVKTAPRARGALAR